MLRTLIGIMEKLGGGGAAKEIVPEITASAEMIVVGAGLTGATTAALVRKQMGPKMMVLDKGRGAGQTGVY